MPAFASPESRPGSGVAYPRRGYLLLAAVTLFWGLNFPIMKLVLRELPPWTFRTACLLLGGLGLLLVCRLVGQPIRLPGDQLRPLLWTTLFNITGWHIFSAYGIMAMQAGRAVIIAYTMPLWSAILAVWLLGERPDWRQGVGLSLGLVGLLVLVSPDLGRLGASPVGLLCMLAASWCWAAGTVLIKRTPWRLPMILVTAWMMLLGGLPVLAGMLFLEPLDAITRLSPTAILCLVYIIGLPMLFCHWAFNRVVQLFPVSLASLSMLATPVLGVLVSAWFLNESFGLGGVVALGLVTAGLAVVLLKK